MATAKFHNPWFVKHDIDGFFGLMIDNLVQLLLIVSLTSTVCGFPSELIYTRILPATAISVILGNIYYTIQARELARRTRRTDVTALPFGINTPSVIAFIFFIMGPVYQSNRAALGDQEAAFLAWQIGIIACIGSGLIEFFGAFFAESIRRATPRAALISGLAGIAIGFISMSFILQVFEHPLLALIPMGLILIQYFSGARLPWGLPAGLAALIIGSLLGWGIKIFTMYWNPATVPTGVQEWLLHEVSSMPADFTVLRENIRPILPQSFNHIIPPSVYSEVQDFVMNRWELVAQYLHVIIPMGIFNLIGSLQNIESARAAGDKYDTTPPLMVNGLCTLIAAGFGSCFPTTIYIGHVGWKKLGARTGYSLLNGVAIALICVLGLVKSISALVPLESVIGILLWIALIIIGQAFQTVPRRHAPAVALGLIPGIAAWGLMIFVAGLTAGGLDLSKLNLAEMNKLIGDAHIGGLITLSRGFILSSVCLAAMGVMIIDRHFSQAAWWAFLLAILSFFGIIHGIDPANLHHEYFSELGAGWPFAIGYLVIGAILMGLRKQARVVAVPGDLATTGYGPITSRRDPTLPRITSASPQMRLPDPALVTRESAAAERRPNVLTPVQGVAPPPHQPMPPTRPQPPVQPAVPPPTVVIKPEPGTTAAAAAPVAQRPLLFPTPERPATPAPPRDPLAAIPQQPSAAPRPVTPPTPSTAPTSPGVPPSSSGLLGARPLTTPPPTSQPISSQPSASTDAPPAPRPPLIQTGLNPASQPADKPTETKTESLFLKPPPPAAKTPEEESTPIPPKPPAPPPGGFRQ